MILRGNPRMRSCIKEWWIRYKVITDSGIVPNTISTDGGYASKANLEYAKDKEIANIVFTKTMGSLKNIAISVNTTV
jgi:hypothetical protein